MDLRQKLFIAEIGLGLANPTAVLWTAVEMLRYMGLFETAVTIENAMLLALASPLSRTRDLKGSAGTAGFTDAVIGYLGDHYVDYFERKYRKIHVPPMQPELDVIRPQQQRDIGVDIFIDSDHHPHQLGQHLEQLAADSPLILKMISNRGTKVYPPTDGRTDMIDHHRCRFLLRDADASLENHVVLDLLQRISDHYRWCHIEKLPEFDGVTGFTRAQGED